MKHITDFMELAEKCAVKAGLMLKKNAHKPHSISFKSRKNLLTEMDRKSEHVIIKMIKKSYPAHAVISEESGKSGNQGSDYRWVIDPLDGTTNYAHCFNFFSVSIGLMKNHEIITGVVYDPMRDELFSAGKGLGAYLNNKSIKVSNVKTIGAGLLSTGFPYRLGKAMKKNIAYFTSFVMRAQAIRRPGSAALDLCYVASGRFDGFWEMELNPWDTAAGALIVKEAGGTVTDFSGKSFSPFMKQIIASNSIIHKSMLRILRRRD
jgi:myo-inositol-1(or 4)-monophosphatase